jgi:hypothetical protein
MDPHPWTKLYNDLVRGKQKLEEWSNSQINYQREQRYLLQQELKAVQTGNEKEHEAVRANHENKLKELDQSKVTLEKQVEALEQALRDRSGRVAKLEERASTFKKYLNAATMEQQVLFQQSKEACQDAIDQMKNRDSAHKSELAKALRAAEAVKTSLQARIKTAVDESKDTISQRESSYTIQLPVSDRNAVNGEIVDLKQTLNRRDAELRCEKAIVARLEGQDKSNTMVTEKLQSLEDLTKAIAHKVDDRTLRDGELAKVVREDSQTL